MQADDQLDALLQADIDRVESKIQEYEIRLRVEGVGEDMHVHVMGSDEVHAMVRNVMNEDEVLPRYHHLSTKIRIGGVDINPGETFEETGIEEGAVFTVKAENPPLASTTSPPDTDPLFEATIFTDGRLEVTEVASARVIGAWDLSSPEVWAPLAQDREDSGRWWHIPAEEDLYAYRPFRPLTTEEMDLAFSFVASATSIRFASDCSACIYIQCDRIDETQAELVATHGTQAGLGRDGTSEAYRQLRERCSKAEAEANQKLFNVDIYRGRMLRRGNMAYDFQLPHIVFDVERGHADLLWLCCSEDFENDMDNLMLETARISYEAHEEPSWLQMKYPSELSPQGCPGISEVPSHPRSICNHEETGVLLMTPHIFPWKMGIIPQGHSFRKSQGPKRPITSEHFTRTSSPASGEEKSSELNSVLKYPTIVVTNSS